jgi:hypothetical protein
MLAEQIFKWLTAASHSVPTHLSAVARSANDFERGKSDTFFFEAPDLGRLTSLRIGHDNSGFGPAWRLARVEAVNTNTGEQVHKAGNIRGAITE